MDFLLLVLRLVLDGLSPSGRDGMTLAARIDGRMEHHPLRRGFWFRWLSGGEQSPTPRRGKALAVRAERDTPRPRTPSTPSVPRP